MIFLHEVVKTELIKLLSGVSISALFDDGNRDKFSTACWTLDLYFFLIEGSFDVLGNAVTMERMLALQSLQVNIFDVLQAYITGLFFIFQLLSFLYFLFFVILHELFQQYFIHLLLLHSLYILLFFHPLNIPHRLIFLPFPILFLLPHQLCVVPFILFLNYPFISQVFSVYCDLIPVHLHTLPKLLQQIMS